MGKKSTHSSPQKCSPKDFPSKRIAKTSTSPEDNSKQNTDEEGEPEKHPKFCEDPEKCQVFVERIHKNSSEEDLKSLFAECGSIVSLELLKNSHNKFKGMAFILFSNSQEAAKAVQLTGKKHMGKGIKVSLPKPKPSTKVILVKNLPFGVTEDELAKVFEDCGDIKEVRVSPNSAYVEFEATLCAQKAVEKESVQFKGSYLELSYSFERAQHTQKLKNYSLLPFRGRKVIFN